MSNPRFSRLLPSVLVVLAVLSCGESVGPGPTTGIYVLRHVEQDPLPALLVNNEFYATYVLSDTIRLGPAGKGTISGVREFVPLQPDLPAEGPLHITIEIRYDPAWVMGGHLEIEFLCPPNANCVAGPHMIAHRVPGGLRASWASGMLGRSPLFYTEAAGAPGS